MAGTAPILLLRSSAFALCRFLSEHVKTVWLTGDLFSIISWRHLWENSFCAIFSNLKAIRTLLGPRVALYLFTQWRPPITFKETNHTQLPSRDKFRLSLRLWSALLSKTTIWKSGYARRMQVTTLSKRTKKVPVPSEETKRGQKVVMPKANQSDKI